MSFFVNAVHLEPVMELTTSAFIATLRRFGARRGLPSTIWSDMIRDQELSDHCCNQEIHSTFQWIVGSCGEKL